MIFAESITTPANTSAADYKTSMIKITDGVIHEVTIIFPAGCAGLVYFQLFDGGHQFIPSTYGQYLRGDAIDITSKEFYEINTAPRWLTARTWNLDTKYEHTVEVLVKILPKSVLLPVGAYEGVVKSIQSIIVNRGRNGGGG